MNGLELLKLVFAWLPVLFALDLALFHVVGDQPLALRWWFGRDRAANGARAGLRRSQYVVSGTPDPRAARGHERA